MKKHLLLLALFLVFSIAPGFAAETVTIKKDDLNSIVTKLESGKGRKEVLNDLKNMGTAAEANATEPAAAAPAEGDAPKTEAEAKPAEPEKTIAPITQTLGVDSFTNHLIWKYQHFLARNDLNSSTVGKLVLTGILFLLGGIIIFVSRRGATKMLYWFDRAVAWLDLPAARMRLYAKALRTIVTVLVLGLLVYTLTLIWNFEHDITAKITHCFRVIMGSAINIIFVVILATAAWEALNAMIAMAFRRADGANSTRAKTIMPIVRNILFMVFAVMFTLMLLSELGINILPLMAGAGVVGVAVGFGAQTMVKDYLAGFTIVFEDLIRVGDVVKLGEVSGSVEKITLRKIQVRGANNAVFTVPFSAISIIQNNTKDFSAFDWTFTIPFDTDATKAFDVLRKVAKEMKADHTFGPMMMDDIDIWGVDSVNENGQVLKGRLKTTAGQQWAVQREFTRRKVDAFHAANLPNAAMPRSFQVSQVIANYPSPPQPTQDAGVKTPNP